MRVLLISANREVIPSPVVPVGVLALAGAVRDAHEVRVLDLCFEPDFLGAIEKTIGDFDPELVALGLRNLHTNAYDVGGRKGLIQNYANMAAAVRRATRAPLVLGGAGFSLRPKHLMERLGADYGIVGEAERAFRQLTDMVARGETPPTILHGENVIHSDVFPMQRLRRSATIVSDLDMLPPVARDLADPRHYEWEGTENIQTKRGCAFGCTYCDYPDLEGRKVRVRNPKTVAEEVLARAQVPGVKFVFFVDSVFNVPPKAALELCNELIARDNPLPWTCYATPAAFSPELVEAMVRARCYGVEIGTDAGTERILKALKKPFGLKDVLRTRELCEEYGLMDSHTFILGAEDETLDETRRTLDFADQLDPAVSIFVVFSDDREEFDGVQSKNRRKILEILAEEAPKRPGWVVPELALGQNHHDAPPPRGTAGPAWIIAARERWARKRGRSAALP
ncbi:cobalamin-dependent protein [Pendulispora brunnea]|uniref:Cobalamin-dependent protein n=1 Tax=Pendulispora brunnea TaxID=2905690 RepID=A0ABZ2K3F2_9BACT